MKKEKIETTKEAQKTVLDYFSLYKGKTAMAHFSGNFFGGGFYLSKNKIKAVIDNLPELKKFLAGEYDKDIAELQEDEKLSL